MTWTSLDLCALLFLLKSHAYYCFQRRVDAHELECQPTTLMKCYRSCAYTREIALRKCKKVLKESSWPYRVKKMGKDSTLCKFLEYEFFFAVHHLQSLRNIPSLLNNKPRETRLISSFNTFDHFWVYQTGSIVAHEMQR